jgi:hypothetical protein
MKKLSLILVAILVGLASCNKSDKTSSTANFNITGLKDVDLTNTSNASFTLPISIVPAGGAADTVSLTFSGLPDGVGVDYSPATGITPFTSSLKFTYDYSGTGGTYPVTITGVGHSGEKSYTVNVTLGDYRGWRFGGIQYDRKGVAKYQGGPLNYSSIIVDGGGARLTINFGQGKKLPTATRTYKISSYADTSDNIQVTMQDVNTLFISTGKSTDGVTIPTGTFTFDTLGRFTFKCTNIEMTDGLSKQNLSATFSE